MSCTHKKRHPLALCLLCLHEQRQRKKDAEEVDKRIEHGILIDDHNKEALEEFFEKYEK